MTLDSVKSTAAAAFTGGAAMQGKPAEPAKTVGMENVGGAENFAEKNTVHIEKTAAGGAQEKHGGGQSSDPEAERRLKSAIQQANSKIKHTGKRNCEFAYHEESRRISIKVYDAATKEVIREIPAEETLQMVEKMYELAGILVDEKR